MLLSRRWLGRHALLLAAVGLFALLGWWQLGRAEGGNGRSIGYAVEWPLFAAFAIYWWGRTIYVERHPPAAAAQPDQQTGGPAQDGGQQPATHRIGRPAIEEAPDEELDAYNQHLAWLHAQDQRMAR